MKTDDRSGDLTPVATSTPVDPVVRMSHGLSRSQG